MSKEECRNQIVSEEIMDFFIAYLDNEKKIYESYQPECVQLTGGKRLVAYFDLEKDFLDKSMSYRNESFPKCYGLMNDSALDSIGVSRLRRQPYLDLFGNNVLIGFVDTGIDYQNPLFIKADKTSRILSIWDQTRQDGQMPEYISYGSVYSGQMINEALSAAEPLRIVPSVDEIGHGTRMAAVAAGNIDKASGFSGVAPLADIAVVKLKPAKKYLREYYFIKDDAICYQENDIILGIYYLILLSFQLAKPLVLCLGVGTNSGDHDGSSILAEYLDLFANYEGKCFVTALGNEGNAKTHYRSRFFGNGRFPSISSGALLDQNGKFYEDVQFRVGEREKGFLMELWAQTPNLFSVRVISPSGEFVTIPYNGIIRSSTFRFLFEDTILYADFYINEALAGDPFLAMRFSTPAAGIWTLRVIDERNFGGGFDVWLPIRAFIGEDTYFLMPDPDVTLCDPGDCQSVISVSMYDYRNDSFALESSRGYRRNGGIKPELCAPGVGIEIPGEGIYTGTSLASAYTAGSAALLMEWGIVKGNYIYMKTRDVKNFMILGAERKNMIYPNRLWGYGSLNIYETFDSLRNTML